MAESFGMPVSSMSKINRYMQAKKASGQTVQPWETAAAYEGELNSAADKRNASRALTLQAARDAEQARMNQVNTDLTEKGLSNQREGSYLQLAGTGLTTLGMYNLLKKKPAIDVPQLSPSTTGVKLGGQPEQFTVNNDLATIGGEPYTSSIGDAGPGVDAYGIAEGVGAGADLAAGAGEGLGGYAVGGGMGADAVPDLLEELPNACIIVTACTSRDSEEVNIAREYRDKFLSPETLRGYHMIAEGMVPFIVRFPLVKFIVKRVLVDNLISYGRHALDKGPVPGAISIFVTKLFLALCKTVGNRRTSFVRANGEVV